MSYRGTAVVLDVRNGLSPEKQNEIVASLGLEDGTNDAKFSQYVTRLMLVRYDQKVVSVQTIKTVVDRYFIADGPATCLIGL
ncbi:MAG: hypothetical protein V3R65_06855 [Acidiferrobacterales bacterium]